MFYWIRVSVLNYVGIIARISWCNVFGFNFFFLKLHIHTKWHSVNCVDNCSLLSVYFFCSFVVCLGYLSTYCYWFMKWRKGILGFLSLYRTRKKSIIWFGALLHKMQGFCFLSSANFWNTNFSPLVLYLESKKKKGLFS